MDYEKMMQIALENLNNSVDYNTPFESKNLFNGAEWEALTKKDRISFGRYFANEVSERSVPEVVRLERGKNNHARYMKVRGEEKWLKDYSFLLAALAQ